MASGRKPVIGLTGGIGSGKSLVAQQLASLGCAVIDADELAAAALEEPAVRRQLVQWWGRGILDGGGRVDRRSVAGIVFDRPGELGRLEAEIHPRVHEGRRRLHERHHRDPAVQAIVEDCPLLLEKGLDKGCDVVIFVSCDQETRLRRLEATRRWTASDLHRREKNQLPLDTKAQRADYAIENNAGEVDCLSHVRRIFSQVMTTFGG